VAEVHDPTDHGDQLLHFAAALAGLAVAVAAAAYAVRPGPYTHLRAHET